MKVAIVHDWLNGMRGGEKVLEFLCVLYPEATLYTLFYEKGKLNDTIESMNIKTSFIQKLPGVFKHYRNYLPLFRRAIESFNLEGYDLVVSTSHCVAKNIKIPDNVLHLCYCHTPMRYAFDKFDDYFPREKTNPIKYKIIKSIISSIRKWDIATSDRVDHYAANSKNIARKIEEYYGRKARIIYPPVDTGFFSPEDVDEDYFLIVSAMVQYKRIDVAIEAFKKNGKKLIIVGKGPLEKALREQAKGCENIEFRGWVDQDELKKSYARCKALVFTADEDCGIVPMEAQSCGRPVIAFKKGGALETVLNKRTGLFYEEQSPESLNTAIEDFDTRRFNKEAIRNHAMKFTAYEFKTKMVEWIADKLPS